MAITWGTWRYGDAGLPSANGMRVGLEVISWSAVNSGSASITATVEVWTENQYTHSGDTQTLTYSNLGSATNYTNNSGGSPVKRATKTYTYSYSTWGSSPGNVTFTAELTGHYWDDGTNPTVSLTVAIPGRPGGPPTVDSASATAGIRSASISWSGSGDPGIYQYNVYRNNDGNQLIYAAGGTSVTDTALGNGQEVFYIVYAYNAAGNGYRFTNTVTTPSLPSNPSSLTADASTFGTVGLSWTASSGSGYTVTYTVRRDGTTLGTTTSTSYSDTTVAPSTAYTYTVSATTDVGASAGAASVTVTSLGGIARIWNGTANVTSLPQIWNGTAWTNAQARVWNGTEWKYGS